MGNVLITIYFPLFEVSFEFLVSLKLSIARFKLCVSHANLLNFHVDQGDGLDTFVFFYAKSWEIETKKT